MWNLSWTPHSCLEKDNSLNHACVSPRMFGVCLPKTQDMNISGLDKHLYYYSSPVRKICPQNRTDFYPHGLNSTPIIAKICLRLHIASPRPLDRSLFAFVLCFLRQKIKKNFASPQLRFLDAIFMRQFSRRCRHRRLLKTAHDFARLRTMLDFYSFITKISFHGSRRFIFTGSCSATHGLLLS